MPPAASAPTWPAGPHAPVPRLEFVLDESLQRAFETVQVIDQAMVELGEPAPWERPPRPDDQAPDEPARAARRGRHPPPHPGRMTDR